jgi:hypothetical protein
MVAGDEHCQLRAAIEVLVPYTSLGSPTFLLATRELPVPAKQSLGRDVNNASATVEVLG